MVIHSVTVDNAAVIYSVVDLLRVYLFFYTSRCKAVIHFKITESIVLVIYSLSEDNVIYFVTVDIVVAFILKQQKMQWFFTL